MKYDKLLVIFGVFLVAVIIHAQYFGREYFTASEKPVRTPLTKENVQALVDEVTLDYLAVYQKYQDLKSNDTRIVYRLKAIGSDLNMINDQYPMIQYTIKNLKFSDYPAISLEDLKVIKDYFTYRVGTSFLSDALKPADISDLDQFSARTRFFTAFLGDRAMVARIQLPSDYQITSQAILTNVLKLKQNLVNLKPGDVPILKADLYWFVGSFARNNFIQEPQFKDTPIPVLNTANLPIAKTSLQAIAAAVTGGPAAPPAPAPAAATTPLLSTGSGAATPVGLKFSELVEMLLSYSPIRHSEPMARGQVQSQDTNTATDLLNTQYASAAGPSVADQSSNVLIDKIRTVVRDEIKGIKQGPKDAVNKDLAQRATEPLKKASSTPSANKEVSTDSLEQGKWFRTATDGNCPYAEAQQLSKGAEPVPVPPFNMDDYIRKDSIPCWACTLK